MTPHDPSGSFWDHLLAFLCQVLPGQHGPVLPHEVGPVLPHEVGPVLSHEVGPVLPHEVGPVLPDGFGAPTGQTADSGMRRISAFRYRVPGFQLSGGLAPRRGAVPCSAVDVMGGGMREAHPVLVGELAHDPAGHSGEENAGRHDHGRQDDCAGRD